MTVSDLLPLQLVPTKGQQTARAINTAPERIPKRELPSFTRSSGSKYNRFALSYRREEWDMKLRSMNEIDMAVLATTLKLLRVALGRFASGRLAAAQRALPETLLHEPDHSQLLERFTEQARVFFHEDWRKGVTITINDGRITLLISIRKEPRLQKQRYDRGWGMQTRYTVV